MKTSGLLFLLRVFLLASLLGMGWVENTGSGDEDLWNLIQTKYDEALRSGEAVSSDVKKWIQEDVQNMYRFDYRVVSLPSQDSKNLEATLKLAGKEGWECFSILKIQDGLTLSFKKRPRSYLKTLPFQEFLKILSGINSQEESNEVKE